jgi:MFS-type transporter involved in bile tolerance (Atg22 family)
VALAIAPKVIDNMGERWGAAIAVFMMSLGLFTLAFVDVLAPILGPLSPMNVVRLFGFEPTDEILAASFVSMFTGFAVSMSSISVQTYVNRRVPMIQQGRVFGLQSLLGNAAALVPLLLVGFIAAAFSIEMVMFITPWMVFAGVFMLLLMTNRWAGEEPMSKGEVLSSFWAEPSGEDPPDTG